MKVKILLSLVSAVFLISVNVCNSNSSPDGKGSAEPKDATTMTAEFNSKIINQLPFDNIEDFEDAKRGFIATLDPMFIKDDAGQVVWDMEQFEFQDSEAPKTANPSLWRQEQLNNIHGLFKVSDHIYQVRGYDIANISFIEGKTGWIIIDPLTTAQTAKAALALVDQHLKKRPVKAVIFTHSHVDHFGGIRGVVSESDVKAGKVKIIAPVGFLEHSVSENVIAGNAMIRRASYMFGTLLPKGEKGSLGSGLGKGTGKGMVGLMAPTHIIEKSGQEMTVDGVKIIFQNTPGAEAPAEMVFYFPQFRALCMSEIVTCNLHNLYTLRGAQVRDAQAWSKYINEAMELFGEKSDVVFTSHHWPHWGKEKVIDFLKKQRDLYKFLHDQTMRLANHGYTMLEIAEMIELPESLANEFYNRGYYGTVSHNVKAIYNKYIGYFDGNPANLHPLPPVEASKKYVEFMGGAENVLNKARKAFDKGEYRWVTQVVNHVVFANPENREARFLQAEALEQLGYQAESGPWRNFYLTAAQELRKGVQRTDVGRTSSSDVVKAMTVEMLFDFLSVRLNSEKAEGKKIAIKWNFSDSKEKYLLTVENSVMNYTKRIQAKNADATLTLKRDAFLRIIGKQSTIQEEAQNDKIIINGNVEALSELFSLLDDFDFWFNIVTP